MTLILFCPSYASYHDVKLNGIYYKINKNTKEAKVVANVEKSDTVFGETGWDIVHPSYIGDVVIPESFVYDGTIYTVTSVDGFSWSNGYYFSRGAFEMCDGLTSVTIPKTVNQIGVSAFSGCSSLAKVYIYDLSAWCSIDFQSSLFGFYGSTNPLYYAHNLYLNGTLITDLVIPNDVNEIKDGVFAGANFKSITLNNDVRIGEKSFKECDNLKDFYIYSPKITNVSVNAFCDKNEYSDDFSSLKKIILHVRERYISNYKNDYFWQKFKKIEFIDGVDFHLIYMVNDEKYKNVWYEVGESIVPEKLPTKEGYTFSGWSEIPETMPDHDVIVTGSFTINKYNLTYIVDNKEYKSYDVEYNSEITLEENPKKKGMTFSGWWNVPQTMPAHDVEITGSFSWSKAAIDKIVYEVADTISNYVHIIGNNNASGEIFIPDSIAIDEYRWEVHEITDKAFYGCKDITKVEIPATVTSIRERTFANIDKLTDVTIWAEDIPATDRTAFENSYIEDYVTLHVPGSAIKKYKEQSPWNTFKSIVAADVPMYTITYMVDGAVYKTVKYEEGDKITPETELTRDGFVFSGWSEIPETMPAHDVIVTGTFTVDNTKYTLTYMVDGEVYKSYQLKAGSTIIPLDEPTKEGYTFSGWSEIPEEMPSHDVTITGTFTRIPLGKCASPTVELKGGRIVFGCETEGVEFNYDIKSNVSLKGKGNDILVNPSISVSVYASKDGYDNSDVTTKDILLSSSGINLDANGDGVINAADVVAIVNMIMSSK